MKKNQPIIIIAIVCILAVVAWIVMKSPTQDDDTSNQQSAEQSKSARKNTASSKSEGRSGRRKPIKSPVKAVDNGDGTMTLPAGEPVARTKSEREQHKIDILNKRVTSSFLLRLDKLVKELGLSESQANQLRAQMENALAEISKEKDPRVAANKLTDLLAAMGIENMPAGLLNDEQKKKYTALLEREHTNAIETLAMDRMSFMQQGLDLTSEQKDKLHELMLSQAEQLVDNRSSREKIQAQEKPTTSSFNISIDPITNATVAQYRAGEIDGRKMTSREAITALKAQINENLEKHLQSVSSILDKQQLESYRKQITTRNRTFMSMLDSTEEYKGNDTQLTPVFPERQR